MRRSAHVHDRLAATLADPTLAAVRSSSVMPAFARALADVLDADLAGAYRALPGARMWSLDFAHWEGPLGDFETPHAVFVRSCTDPRKFAAYDPLSVELDQQNRVVATADLRRRPGFDETPMRALHEQLGVGPRDSMRVLVSDGPRLLAWVGAYRMRPFRRGDKRVLAGVLPQLHDRLRLERWARELPRAAQLVDALLDAVPVAAYVVRGDGLIDHANAAGRAGLDLDGGRIRHELRAALAGATDAFQLRELSVGGATCYLAIAWQVPTSTLNRNLLVAAAVWRLTTREREVLVRVADGLTNKEIAAALNAAEATIETHLTHIFRKASVDSRALLLAKLLRTS